jgi:hypothetical protein
MAYDNPFSQSQFGIDCNDDFIPFNTTGTIMYLESCVPMDWETRNLPIIMLTGEDWDPVNVGFGNGHSCTMHKDEGRKDVIDVL